MCLPDVPGMSSKPVQRLDVIRMLADTSDWYNIAVNAVAEVVAAVVVAAADLTQAFDWMIPSPCVRVVAALDVCFPAVVETCEVEDRKRLAVVHCRW